MKYSLFIVFLFIGISYGFFGSIGQAISNVDNTVQSTANEIANQVDNTVQSGTDQVGQAVENVATGVQKEVENVISQLLDIANGIKFAANFLWDSVFSPAINMMIQGGQLFLVDQLGATANITNYPIAIPENPLSDKYAQLVAQLKSNIHHLYEQLFLMEQEALKALEKGELNFEERIRAFYDKIDAIQKQINEWAEVTKYELEVYALTILGDWENILNQYKQNIDSTVQSIERMFQQLTENLMKNILEGVVSVVPNAANIIENMKSQGLLTFFHN